MLLIKEYIIHPTRKGATRVLQFYTKFSSSNIAAEHCYLGQSKKELSVCSCRLPLRHMESVSSPLQLQHPKKQKKNDNIHKQDEC